MYVNMSRFSLLMFVFVLKCSSVQLQCWSAGLANKFPPVILHHQQSIKHQPSSWACIGVDFDDLRPR